MKRSLFLALAVVLASLPLLTSNSGAVACKDVEFIFARGSGGNVGEDNYKVWENAVISTMSGSSLKYNFYELGTNSYNGARYPSAAIGVKDLKTIGTSLSALLSAYHIGSFSASVDAGGKELAGRIAFVSSSCPNTKFVLAGYSQGAMTMSRALPNLPAEKIAYVATFGDPTLYLPEGEGIIPPACRGLWYSDYRVYAPNCRTHAGMLGANKPYEPDGYVGKVGIWCTKQDLFCSNSINLFDITKDHLAYADDGFYLDSAKKIREELVEYFPEAFEEEAVSTRPKKRNTVLLIDSTSSMESTIDLFKSTALKIAKDTLDAGGDIAVFEFRDAEVDEGYETPHQLVDFGGSYEEIEAAVNGITTDGGGDIPESALSASLHVLNTMKWQRGATKSIVLLTDAGYRLTEADGTNVQTVIRRSLEIDPVNIYVVMPYDYYYDEVAPLVEGTNGEFFTLADSYGVQPEIYESILDRPEVNFPLENYLGLIGDEFYFNLDVDTKVAKVEWDLDGDGVFEETTTTPNITKTYSHKFSDIIQARVTDKNGLKSTASVKVDVYASVEEVPEEPSLSPEDQAYLDEFLKTLTFEDASSSKPLKQEASTDEPSSNGSVSSSTTANSVSKSFLSIEIKELLTSDFNVYAPNCGKR